MKKLIFVFISLMLLCSCSEDVVYERVTLFRPGEYRSQNYRIPAVITARDGTLVTLTDKRKYNDIDLPHDIDVVCRYSEDKGATWSEPLTVAEGQGYNKGFGDAAVTYTNDDNGLIAVFVGGVGFWKSNSENPLRTYKVVSLDGGRTWSEPEDITHFIYGEGGADPVRRGWRSSFCASGNGLLTSNGRIMFVAAVRESVRCERIMVVDCWK